MNEQKSTQIQRVLKYLEKYGSITQDEALNILGVVHLAPIISDLKSVGYPIVRKTGAVKNCRYHLQSVNASKIEVGAKICKTPIVFEYLHSDWDEYHNVNMEGTIVYVNFPHKYFTVEYEFKNGMKFRESFKMDHPKPTGVHHWAVDE